MIHWKFVYILNMFDKIADTTKWVVTILTFARLFSCVYSHMSNKFVFLLALEIALATTNLSLVSVSKNIMLLKDSLCLSFIVTFCTVVWPFTRMHQKVFIESTSTLCLIHTTFMRTLVLLICMFLGVMGLILKLTLKMFPTDMTNYRFQTVLGMHTADMIFKVCWRPNLFPQY